MDTICTPLVAGLLFFLLKSLSADHVFGAFNYISRYLDDLLNIEHLYLN